MNRIEKLKKIGEDICNRALAEDRRLTKSESEECQRVIQTIKDARDEERLAEQIDRLSAFSQSGSDSIADTFRRKAADAGTYVPVDFPAKDILGVSEADASPARLSGIRELGYDTRFAYSTLPRRDLGSATSVEELVQDSRTLADPATMVLGLTSGDPKPVTTTGVVLEQHEVKMVASISEDLPNKLVELDAFNRLVSTTLRQAFRGAVDAHVIGELEAGAGHVSDAGADLLERLRKGRTAIEASGHSPSVALVSPADAEALDLLRTDAGDGAFLLSPSPRSANAGSPLWGLRLVTATGVDDPLILDPSGVTMFAGAVRLDADPFTGFANNTVRFRYEGPIALVIHSPDAVYRVGTPE